MKNQGATILQQARSAGGALSQRELAERAGTAQSVVARIENGASSPTLETLERLLKAAGFGYELRLIPLSPKDVVVESYKPGIDRTLLRENLRKAPDDRVRTLEAMHRFSDEARRARALRVAEKRR
jgi:transcriptional regulator with XRE-family HTH domain